MRSNMAGPFGGYKCVDVPITFSVSSIYFVRENLHDYFRFNYFVYCHTFRNHQLLSYLKKLLLTPVDGNVISIIKALVFKPERPHL